MTTQEKIAKINALLSALDCQIVQVDGDVVIILDHEHDKEASAESMSLPDVDANWKIN